LTRPEDPQAALLLAINHSGDSDSTGAITGNLLGTWHGRQNLPQSWITALEGRTAIERLAADFARVFNDEPISDPAWSNRYPDPP
jgi:ADP-ribosylglycohydrolase